MTTRVRLACIDGCHLLRHAVVYALRALPDFEVVADCEDLRSGARVVDALRPEIVLLDNTLPDADGVVAARLLHERGPGTRVVVLLPTPRRDQAVDLLAEGVRGVVLKTQQWEDFVHALRLVASGEIYVAAELAHDVQLALQRRGDGRPAGPLGLLSSREREVFRLVMKGMTTETIAHTLGIGVRTIDSHRAKIKRKLGLRSTSDIARIAIHYGILTEA